MIELIVIGVIALFALITAAMSVRFVSQTDRAVVERFGKYLRYCDPGLNFIVPFVDRMIHVDITERMRNVEPQDIITKDNLNAQVDLVIYYKVKPNQDSVYKSLYNVQSFESQIIMLAQTTARNVIGDMEFKDVNSKRNVLNQKLAAVLDKEAKEWGVQVVRAELLQITPPGDVQGTMNEVIKAENEKIAAVNHATAVETEADGQKRAEIKMAEGSRQASILSAEGNRQARILEAEGVAKAIQLENEAAQKYFKGPAQTLKALQATVESLSSGSKFVITDGKGGLVNVMNELSGTNVPAIIPIKGEKA